ncbi:MAG: hypothetical protein P8Y48_13645 [Novosphingobium sp.]
MIGVYQESDGFRDYGDSDRLLVAPSIAFDPGEGIHFLYQLEYNFVHFRHDRGLARRTLQRPVYAQ